MSSYHFCSTRSCFLNKSLIFFQSVRSGDYAEVKRLIKAGADGNAQFNDGSKALIIVALQYGHPEVAQLLIEAGAK